MAGKWIAGKPEPFAPKKNNMKNHPETNVGSYCRPNGIATFAKKIAWKTYI